MKYQKKIIVDDLIFKGVTSYPVANQRKDPSNLIHVIDMVDEPTATTTANILTVENDSHRILISTLSQSSTTSQSRSSSSHQVNHFKP